MVSNRKVGLSLSGGGYRAAAFHLGTLKKLYKLKILDKIDVISTISGGSIIGAFYCLNINDFEKFEEELKNRLNKSVLLKVIFNLRFGLSVLIILSFIATIIILSFSIFPWTSAIAGLVFIALILRFQFVIFPVSKIIRKVYDKMFFNKRTLSQLPELPELVINATNLETTTLFSFSKRKMEDSSYKFKLKREIIFKNNSFPISLAVAASTCVPIFFSPVKICKKYFQNQDDSKIVSPNLVDGGVYDNQGIHKITQDKSSYECQVIITSDAGNILPFEKKYFNLIAVMSRTSEVFMRRIKSLQFIQNIYMNKGNKQRQIAYISLGWDVDGCINGFADNLINGNVIQEVISAHKIPKDIINKEKKSEIVSFMKDAIKYSEIISNNILPDNISEIKKTKTNLTALSKERIEDLVNYASLLTEIQIKLYCPILLNKLENGN